MVSSRRWEALVQPDIASLPPCRSRHKFRINVLCIVLAEYICKFNCAYTSSSSASSVREITTRIKRTVCARSLLHFGRPSPPVAAPIRSTREHECARPNRVSGMWNGSTLYKTIDPARIHLAQSASRSLSPLIGREADDPDP